MTNQKTILLGSVSIIFLLALISLTSSVSVSIGNIFLKDSLGMNSSQIIFTNSDLNITPTITFTLSQNLQDKITLSLNQLTITNNGTLTLSVKQNVQNGIYSGSLNWVSTDGTNGIIDIDLLIENTQSTNTCQLNPSLIFYTQSVQQGTEFELPKITFNPTNCQGDFSIVNAYITGGITTSEGMKPVYLKSAGNNEIILGVNTAGLSSRTYNSKLTVTAFGKTFTDISNIDIIVTTGTDPAGNFSITALPTCSLSKTTLALNSTYSLICTGIQPDVQVIPSSNPEYIIGTGTETTTSQYIWYFQPQKFGVTKIFANFYYRGSPVGKPFEQEVRITSTGNIGGGTNLKFIFTPTLDKAKPNENITIQIADNLTDSLVSDSILFIDSQNINTKDGYTFFWVFEPNTIYSFRGKAQGYEDLVQELKLTSQDMNISINPLTGDSDTVFNISTYDVNASLFLNGNKITNPYTGKIPPGNNTIKAIAEGYFDLEKNLSVAVGINPILTTEWAKGKEQIVAVSRPIKYTLVYKEKSDSIEEKGLIMSEGDTITFKPEKKGLYILKDSEKGVIWQNEIKGWDYKILGWHIIWWILSLGFLFVLIMVLKTKKSSEGMAGMVRY